MSDQNLVRSVRTPSSITFYRRDGGDEGLQHMSVSGHNANIIFGGDQNGNNFLSSTPSAAAARAIMGDDGGDGDLGDYRSPIDTTTQL